MNDEEFLAMLNEALTKDLVPADCYEYECFQGGPVLSREELAEINVEAPWH